MKPIDDQDRVVANIHEAAFQPFTSSAGHPDGEVLQVNGGLTGYGFHVYRMAAGQVTIPHTHLGDEEFFLLQGDLRDHDGFVYKPGDLVWLKSGTQHSSHSETGCVLVVYLPGSKDV